MKHRFTKVDASAGRYAIGPQTTLLASFTATVGIAKDIQERHL